MIYSEIYRAIAAPAFMDSSKVSSVSVRPALSLALNFLSAPLDPRITFTRASSATYFGSDGLLKTAANDVPRFDYDPATPAGTTGVEQCTASGYGVPTLYDNTLSGVTDSGFTVLPGSTSSRVYIDIPSASPGKSYLLTAYCVSAPATGTLSMVGRDGAMGAGGGVSLIGTPLVMTSGNTFSYTFTAASVDTGVLWFSSAVAVGFSVSNISVKEVTFAPKGLLIEESRTNLLLQSQSFGTTWGPGTSLTDVDVTENVIAAPDGTVTADKIREKATTSAHYFVQSTVTAASGTFSIYFKAAERSKAFIYIESSAKAIAYFDLSAGTVGTVSGSLSPTATITSLSNGWYRCSIFASGITVGQPVGFGPTTTDNVASYLGVATNGVYIWGAQLEVGPAATSYIPTTTSAVTRAADRPALPAAGWYNATSGTFVVDFDGGRDGTQNGYGRVIGSDTFNNNAVIATDGVTNRLSWYDGVFSGNSGVIAGADYWAVGGKAAFAYGPSDTAICGKGSTPVNSTNNINRSASNFMLGGNYSSMTNILNGHIRSVRYYKTRLPNATLQSLTA